MVVEEGTSDGETIKFAASFPNSKAEVVNGVEFENGTFDSSMRLASDGFRTYKRRKRSKSSSESELVEGGSLPVGTGRRPMDKVCSVLLVFPHLILAVLVELDRVALDVYKQIDFTRCECRSIFLLKVFCGVSIQIATCVTV